MAKYNLDPYHTPARFAVRHMMVNLVSGQFCTVSGTLLFGPARVEVSSVEVEIDASSVYTGVQKRDEDLRSANYLDVEKYQKITFRSTGAELAGLDHCLVHGDLTIHGVTRPVTLDTLWAGPPPFSG
jgi:polyisoprenoid-binding protein YceI